MTDDPADGVQLEADALRRMNQLSREIDDRLRAAAEIVMEALGETEGRSAIAESGVTEVRVIHGPAGGAQDEIIVYTIVHGPDGSCGVYQEPPGICYPCGSPSVPVPTTPVVLKA